MESKTLETRLGPLAWRSSGTGPALVFFAGALANGGSVARRRRRARGPLPLHHDRPPAGSASLAAVGRSGPIGHFAGSADARLPRTARAGGRHGRRQRHGRRLLLLSLATGHPALARMGRLVLTNCDSYDKFPPDALKNGRGDCRRSPARAGAASAAASVIGRAAQGLATVAARGLDPSARVILRAGADAIPGGRRSRRAPWAACVRSCCSMPPEAIPRFDRPVLLIWGDASTSSRSRTRSGSRRTSPTRTLTTVPAPRPGCPSTTRPRWPTRSPGSFRRPLRCRDAAQSRQRPDSAVSRIRSRVSMQA